MLSVMDATLDTIKGPIRSLWRKDERQEVNRLRPKARRFVFSDQASFRLGCLIKTMQRDMLENRRFAIPPYETTYLELNVDQLYNGMEVSNTSAEILGYKKDIRVGYLMHDGITRVFASSAEDNTEVGPGPFVFYDGVRCPHPVSHLNGFPDFQLGKVACLIGSGLHLIDDSTAAELIENFSMSPSYVTRDGKPDMDYPRAITIGGCGDMRNCMAALLVMNAPHFAQMIAVPRKSSLSRGHRVVYAAHNVVEIDLTPDQLRTYLASTSRHVGPKRRHEVRGHFAHYHRVKGCEHDYPLEPVASASNAPTWTCRKCGTLRVWKSAYERGDASIGFVTKHYDVKSESH